jgi:2-aminoadipate transaminase
MRIENLLADRTRSMGANVIREILKVVSQPGMVSLAGGIPAPESFPLEIIPELTDRVVATWGAEALQYGPTEGFGPLREALAVHLQSCGIAAGSADVLVGSGSQGILDAVGKIFISQGDRIAVEAPTYLGALHAFTAYRPAYVRLQTDAFGVIPESLEKVLETGKVKLVYLVPTFQNPTGRTLPLDRRQAVADSITRHGAVLIEDDPYSALRYSGRDVAPIHSLAPDNVVYVSTLSKVFAPGLRIGFCVAPPAIRKWLVIVKQGTDLHTSTFNQALAAEYLAGGYLERVLPKIVSLYRPRLTAMMRALDTHFPSTITWSRPEGGMFVWAQGPQGMDMDAVYHEAVQRGVAFVPGRYFFPDPREGIETMRLNFTMTDETTLERAVSVLAQVIRGWEMGNGK